jgi:uncharacterized protein YqeY
MSLKVQLEKDMKESLRRGDKLRLSTIRLIRSYIRDAEIEKRREFSDENIYGVLATAIRSHEESLVYYRKAGREDLVEREEAELAIIRSYLPPPLSEDEIGTIIDEAMKEVSAQGMKDMGKVMSKVMPLVKGRADGTSVNRMVQQKFKG